LGLARGHIRVLAELAAIPGALDRHLGHITDAALEGESLLGARLLPERIVAYGVADGIAVWEMAGARRRLPPPLRARPVGQVIPLFTPVEPAAASVGRMAMR
jgi:hypothetical protein